MMCDIHNDVGPSYRPGIRDYVTVNLVGISNCDTV